MKKQDLPVKICATCNRPFTWRKKWRNNWEQVLYCSKRCSGERRSGDNPSAVNSDNGKPD